MNPNPHTTEKIRKLMQLRDDARLVLNDIGLFQRFEKIVDEEIASLMEKPAEAIYSKDNDGMIHMDNPAPSKPEGVFTHCPDCGQKNRTGVISYIWDA